MRLFWVFFLFFIYQYHLRGLPATSGNYQNVWAHYFQKKSSCKPNEPKSNRIEKLFLDAIIVTKPELLKKKDALFLTGLNEKSNITKEQLDRAHEYLMSTGKYLRVEFHLSIKKKTFLFIDVTPAWLFKKVIISPFRERQEKYLSLYTQKEGASFDIAAHENDILQIKKTLKQDGYYTAQVQDFLHYSPQSHTITTAISIKKGPRLQIKKVNLSCPKNIDILLKNHLNEYLAKELLKKKYSHEKILKIIHSIETKLKEAGYFQVKIIGKKKIILSRNALELSFFIFHKTGQRINFFGNSFFSHAFIREKILNPEQPTWLFKPEIIITQLKHEYFNHGFWFTQIKSKTNKENDCIDIFIQENNPVIIDSFLFVNDFRKESKQKTHLDKVVALCEELFLEHINKPYNKDSIDKLIAIIKNIFKKNGYWDIEIGKTFLKKNKYQNYNVYLPIQTNKLYLWQGFTTKFHDTTEKIIQVELEDLLSKFFLKQSTKIFDVNLIEEQQEKILDFLQSKGYWHAQVLPLLLEKSTTEESKELIIEWNITAHEQIVFGKIIPKGISSIDTKRLILLSKLKEGHPWDKKKIELSNRELKRLNIFKSIKITPYNYLKKDKLQPIHLYLIEDNSIEMRSRIGYFYTNKNLSFKRESTPLLGGSWIFRNPTNQADLLTITADWTRFEQKYTAEYYQPCIFLSQITAKSRLFYHHYIHPIDENSTQPAYTSKKAGLFVNFSQECFSHGYLGISTGIELVETSNVNGYLKINNNMLGIFIPFAFFEKSLLVDYRDDQLDPRQGQLFFITGKIAAAAKPSPLFASSFLSEIAHFYSYKDTLTLALRCRFGLFLQKIEKIIPSERFYLGGPQTIRGYGKDAVPPLGVIEVNKSNAKRKKYCVTRALQENTTVLKTISPQGGSSMININAELRLRPFLQCQMVIFQDMGSLSQGKLSLLKENMVFSTGVGIRYKTPLGFIRADIARKWRVIFPEESYYGWHLTVGQAF